VGVVAGTSILQPRLLAAAPVFLNIHAGLTPRYRGAHGAFWAVMEGRPDLAGVTVHVVDQGIDTGGIVEQAAIRIEPDDTPRTLVAKQYLAAWPLLAGAVRAALDGRLAARRRDDLESRLWYSPTPGSYWQYRRQLRKITRNS
jgi:methionyl-tRNA formyltransferase